MDELGYPPRARFVCVLAVVAASLATLFCGHKSTPTSPSSLPDASVSAPPTPSPSSEPPAVLVGAGDIAACGSTLPDAEATARLLDGIGGTVFTTGDNVLGQGTAQQFHDCYEPTWGRHKARTRPTPGNHDYESPDATPYYQYFGSAAGPAGLGYYSYDVGAWHVIALNANISMKAGSPQAAWLRQDLDAHRSGCTLAYWHQPLFSSGSNGNSPAVRDAWQLLYDSGADIVVNGHDHLYERFAPQDPSGQLDLARGIRQFTAGTGGYHLYDVAHLQPNSEVQKSVHGVLKFTLRAGGYEWEFVPVPGVSFHDAGSGTCH